MPHYPTQHRIAPTIHPRNILTIIQPPKCKHWVGLIFTGWGSFFVSHAMSHSHVRFQFLLEEIFWHLQNFKPILFYHRLNRIVTAMNAPVWGTKGLVIQPSDSDLAPTLVGDWWMAVSYYGFTSSQVRFMENLGRMFCHLFWYNKNRNLRLHDIK